MISTIAMGDVHDLFVRRLSAVITTIDMKTRRIKMAERARQPQTRGRCGGNEAVEFRHTKVVEGIEGAPSVLRWRPQCLGQGGERAACSGKNGGRGRAVG